MSDEHGATQREVHALRAEVEALRKGFKPDRPTPRQYTQHPPELDWLPASGNHPDLGLLVTERDALSAMAYRDAQIDKLRAEVRRLTAENRVAAKATYERAAEKCNAIQKMTTIDVSSKWSVGYATAAIACESAIRAMGESDAE